MKNAFYVWALMGALSLPIGAATVEGNTITLSPDEAKDCSKEGGCSIYTRESLQKLVDSAARSAFNAGLKAGKASNSGVGCIKTDYRP